MAYFNGKRVFFSPRIHLDGGGLPYTEVETLPEMSDDVKGKIYKLGDSYYSLHGSEIGSGFLVAGKTLGWGEFTLPINNKDILASIESGTHELFTFWSSTAGTITVNYYGASYGEGYIYFPGGEGGGLYKYLYDLYGDIYLSAEYPGSTEILSVTELGAKVFGGVVDDWRNCITGESYVSKEGRVIEQ